MQGFPPRSSASRRAGSARRRWPQRPPSRCRTSRRVPLSYSDPSVNDRSGPGHGRSRQISSVSPSECLSSREPRSAGFTHWRNEETALPSQTRRWFTGLAASMALWPAGSEAQATAGSFEELGGLVKAEETVVVTDMNGRVRGALSAVGKDSLSLVIDGRTQSFARSEVSTVRLTDGLGNGALIGAGVGAGAALGILAIVGSGDGMSSLRRKWERLYSCRVLVPLLRRGGQSCLCVAAARRAKRTGVKVETGPTQNRESITPPEPAPPPDTGR